MPTIRERLRCPVCGLCSAEGRFGISGSHFDPEHPGHRLGVVRYIYPLRRDRGGDIEDVGLPDLNQLQALRDVLQRSLNQVDEAIADHY